VNVNDNTVAGLVPCDFSPRTSSVRTHALITDIVALSRRRGCPGRVPARGLRKKAASSEYHHDEVRTVRRRGPGRYEILRAMRRAARFNLPVVRCGQPARAQILRALRKPTCQQPTGKGAVELPP
jgi:hypothetical protein